MIFFTRELVLGQGKTDQRVEKQDGDRRNNRNDRAVHQPSEKQRRIEDFLIVVDDRVFRKIALTVYLGGGFEGREGHPKERKDHDHDQYR